MSNPENNDNREERALDALIASAFIEDSCVDDEQEIEKCGKSLTDDDRAIINSAGQGLIESLFAEKAEKPTPKTKDKLATAMNRSDEGTPLTRKASEEIEQKIREANERRKLQEQAKKAEAQAREGRAIKEHDLVRVSEHLDVEGYSLKAGMTGTVVSIYREGEAFAVEIASLDRGSAVVTLYRGQIELVEGSNG